MGFIKRLVFLISIVRLVPHLAIFKTHKNRFVVGYDVNRWLEIMGLNKGTTHGFLFLMTFFPEFRNLFYHRTGVYGKVFEPLCPRMKTLFLQTPEIGPGLFIQHGFATIVAAVKIGKDCWINQQVTIGYRNITDCPTLEDHTTINAGAKVIGKVTIGKNSIVGANAVVVKNVPENCTVVGVPAYIVRRNGARVKENL